MMLRLEEITKDREEKMNVLWSKFQVLLRSYSEATGEKYAEYVELRERDNAATMEIHQQYLEIARSTRDISLLKSILESQTHEHQLHMRQLNDYQTTLMEKQKKLKIGMNNTEKVNKRQLKTMVICSTEVNTVSDITYNEYIDQEIVDNTFQLILEIGKNIVEREEHSATHFYLQQI